MFYLCPRFSNNSCNKLALIIDVILGKKLLEIKNIINFLINVIGGFSLERVKEKEILHLYIAQHQYHRLKVCTLHLYTFPLKRSIFIYSRQQFDERNSFKKQF